MKRLALAKVSKTPFSLICKRGRSKELFIRTMRELLVKQTEGQAK